MNFLYTLIRRALKTVEDKADIGGFESHNKDIPSNRPTGMSNLFYRLEPTWTSDPYVLHSYLKTVCNVFKTAMKLKVTVAYYEAKPNLLMEPKGFEPSFLGDEPSPCHEHTHNVVIIAPLLPDKAPHILKAASRVR